MSPARVGDGDDRYIRGMLREGPRARRRALTNDVARRGIYNSRLSVQLTAGNWGRDTPES